MYGNGLVEFGGVSMDRTTVMLTDQIRKTSLLHAIGSPIDSRTFSPRAVG